MGVASISNHLLYSIVSYIIASALAVFVTFFLLHEMYGIIFGNHRILGK